MSLTFRNFQALNAHRCRTDFHQSADWPLENWALAIAGESGELCNIVKKILRGDFSLEAKRGELLAELADIITYCDLAITHLGGDTETALMDKFEVVNARIRQRNLEAAGVGARAPAHKEAP